MTVMEEQSNCAKEDREGMASVETDDLVLMRPGLQPVLV